MSKDDAFGQFTSSKRALWVLGIFLIATIAICVVVPMVININCIPLNQEIGSTQAVTTSKPTTRPTNPPTTKAPQTTAATTAATNAATTGATTQATIPPTPPVNPCLAVTEKNRLDCFADYSFSNPSSCANRRCCWRPISTGGVPWCIYSDKFSFYNSTVRTMPFGIRAILMRDAFMPVHYGNAPNMIYADFQFQTNERLRMKIYDPNNKRFEVPIPMPTMSDTDNQASDPLYEVEVLTKPVFTIIVKRKSTGTKIIDTTLGPLVFEDQYLELSTRLPSTNLYGLGEHVHSTFMHKDFHWKRIPIFARDQAPVLNANLYGSHPMYLNVEDDAANSHTVLLMNSNAMEVILTGAPGLQWRTTGGILDFYITMGPMPHQAVQQYIKMIGLPYFPPYWSLGFQLCRWGYNSLDRVKQVVEEVRSFDIPHDVQYGDIDYMKHALDFTWDPVNYAGLPEFVNDLRSRGMRYIIILDPAISDNQTAGTYPPYDNGVKMDIFIKDGEGKTLIGKVWPRGNATFPDYTNPNTTIWWQELIVNFRKNITFDGLWIDMNEPANFVEGSMKGCPKNKYNNPPYKPLSIFGSTLNDKTICMDSMQHWGLHYDVHSLYGFSETEPTLKAARASTGERSIVISRSTFVSSGKYGGHWLGDNFSTWPDLAYSIIGCLEFNMFGIPYIGADICGFNGNTNENLCNRWMQLGAFYTYSRNHNGRGNSPQHPTAFGAKLANSARKALLVRYKLLPYLYTLFYHANTDGLTVMRSFLFEWPTDPVARNTDRQFLWGAALLITPVLTENAVKVTGYFPDSRWYDYYNGIEVGIRKGNVELSAPYDHINVHVRGGYILPMQEAANNTYFARMNQFSLLVAMDDKITAKGNLFWDDGDSIDTIPKDQYLYVDYTADKTSLKAVVSKNNYVAATTLGEIKVYGLSIPTVSNVLVDGTTTEFTFDSVFKILQISNLNIDMNKAFTITWS
ncbi:Maltase-glucoamylase, intestinal [Trichoplax sp. H2]|nr:Maltase-glucoamylase, intestinal [Trichoplax sp. H2]|eukprot:RDD41927.1 Maltase-glucoamylase, intestinal [Trichoplax sp. H2]